MGTYVHVYIFDTRKEKGVPEIFQFLKMHIICSKSTNVIFSRLSKVLFSLLISLMIGQIFKRNVPLKIYVFDMKW